MKDFDFFRSSRACSQRRSCQICGAFACLDGGGGGIAHERFAHHTRKQCVSWKTEKREREKE